MVVASDVDCDTCGHLGEPVDQQTRCRNLGNARSRPPGRRFCRGRTPTQSHSHDISTACAPLLRVSGWCREHVESSSRSPSGYMECGDKRRTTTQLVLRAATDNIDRLRKSFLNHAHFTVSCPMSDTREMNVDTQRATVSTGNPDLGIFCNGTTRQHAKQQRHDTDASCAQSVQQQCRISAIGMHTLGSVEAPGRMAARPAYDGSDGEFREQQLVLHGSHVCYTAIVVKSADIVRRSTVETTSARWRSRRTSTLGCAREAF